MDSRSSFEKRPSFDKKSSRKSRKSPGSEVQDSSPRSEGRLLLEATPVLKGDSVSESAIKLTRKQKKFVSHFDDLSPATLIQGFLILLFAEVTSLDWICAYSNKGFMTQGRLYLTENEVCFRSALLRKQVSDLLNASKVTGSDCAAIVRTLGC